LGNHEVEDKESVEYEVGSDLLEDPVVAYEEIPHISRNALSRINTY